MPEKLIIKEYEPVRYRLIKGDKKLLVNYLKQRNKEILERDGILKQGLNRMNTSDALHEAIECLMRKNKRPVQKSLENGYESQ